jgi:hypothetical protein
MPVFVQKNTGVSGLSVKVRGHRGNFGCRPYDCTLDSYSEIFGKITNDESITIVGTVHKRYPEPGNPNILELYFPIAKGML